MSDRSTLHPALLPDGLYDLLPPEARHERRLTGALLDVFERYGYAQVSPPLMEYESSFLGGRGEALAGQTFRVMDPQGHAMLAFRPDITMQVSRIAQYRMADAERPLRLSYNGSTLRVRGEPSDRSRQQRQAGIELMGENSPEADAEVIGVAVLALEKAGAKELTLDMHLPGLLDALLNSAGKLDDTTCQHIQAALECKDPSALKALGLDKNLQQTLEGLLAAEGKAGAALEALKQLSLPDSVNAQLMHVGEVLALLSARSLPVQLTLDAAEQRGFEYHHQLSYSIFTATNGGIELGRGGRYFLQDEQGQGTGATLYVNALLRAVPAIATDERVLVPADLDWQNLAQLHEEGLVTVRALDGACDAKNAKAQCCAWRWENGKKVKV